MNHRTPIAIAALAAAALAAPSLASAHHAVVTCGSPYTVTADYLDLSPVTTYGPTTATTVWSDGFTVVNPLPSGCAPTPTPTPPPVVVGPPPVVAEPPPVVVETPRKSPPRLTCADLRARHAGRRWLVARGCLVERRPRITCADVPRGAGPRWFDGSLLGFRCPNPRRRPPVRIAVTG